MKKLLIIALFLFYCVSGHSQEMKKNIQVPDSTKKIMLVEASCGQCNFGLKEHGCALAIRLNGKPLFVDGAGIDEFGDAHANDGFCNAIRKAEVQGYKKKKKFILTYFRLLPDDPVTSDQQQ